jgi:Na+-driven multidrug efflux pump
VLIFAVGDRMILAFGAEPEVAALALPVILLYASLQVIDGVGVVTMGALTGAGDTRFVMRVTVGAAWALKLPVAALGVWLGLGVLGAWLGVGVEIVGVTALALARASGRAWLDAPIPAPAAAVTATAPATATA